MARDFQRRKLRHEAYLGFVGTFCFLTIVQAILNLLRPEPLLWPALLALGSVLLSVSYFRWYRQHFREHTDDATQSE